ncbi:MAG: 30S ribosomal protein S20 [Candidatus Liptonbacteria bacterium]|nr:30S ribosomal protein S20 [Candidatus Liptonbacteria bacterium]
MPKTKSVKKSLRKSLRRKIKNLTQKNNIKTSIRQYKKTIIEKEIEKTKKSLPKIYKIIDKAAKKKIIKKNKAGRLKSRLTQLIMKSSKASL